MKDGFQTLGISLTCGSVIHFVPSLQQINLIVELCIQSAIGVMTIIFLYRKLKTQANVRRSNQLDQQ